MSTHDSLVRMANQIALNFAVMGEIDAVKATADHIHQFWDPRMKRALFDDRMGLDTIADRAVLLLQQQGAPGSQTRATQFAGVDETGASDAG